MKPENIYIVSNRLPVTVVKNENGFSVIPSSGGLATALGSVTNQQSSYWIGWPGIILENKEEEDQVKNLLEPMGFIPVFLSQAEYEGYYNGFSNAILWPLFHYHPGHCLFNVEFWEAYKQVNAKFGLVITNCVPKTDFLWIHDYQLMLLPFFLDHQYMSYFHHIHFPAPEVFGIIPWRAQLLDALLKCRHLVFQTEKDRINFKEACVRYSSKNERNVFNALANERIKVSAHPISIDAYDFSATVSKPTVQDMVAEIKNTFAGQQIILSVDRLDYSKGILERLEAFKLFLDDFPKYREKVVFMMLVVPSRSAVPSYEEHKRKVDELVGNINAQYASLGWRPVHYYYQQVNRETLCAYYAAAQVCLVTSLRDGLNLVSKEFVACRNNDSGVLILSEMAGAAQELSYALKIHPYDIQQMVVAMVYALEMGENEEKARMAALRKQVLGYTVFDWLDKIFEEVFCLYDTLQYTFEQNLSLQLTERIKMRFRHAQKKYILLDYDGCIRELEPYPHMAKPTDEIINLLCNLNSMPDTQVVLVSGRSRNDMSNWFANCGITLIAEHGAWCKAQNSETWEAFGTLPDKDVKEIGKILQKYSQAMEGSFLEEKTSGYCLHFKMCNQDDLHQQIENLDASVRQYLDQHSLHYRCSRTADYFEIHFMECNKGAGVNKYISFADNSFILAAGDDDTDEDLFAILPKTAFTFKIGKKPTKAKIRVPSVERFVSFLQEMVEIPVISR